MNRESRYTILKHSDVRQALSADETETLIYLEERIEAWRELNGKGPLRAVVVESDWPEYESTWQAIERRVEAERLREGLSSLHVRVTRLMDNNRAAGGEAGHAAADAFEYAQSGLESLLAEMTPGTEAADEPTCTWTYDLTDCYYSSACGRDWQFNEGGPAENNVRFCHGCGKRVVVDDLAVAEDEAHERGEP